MFTCVGRFLGGSYSNSIHTDIEGEPAVAFAGQRGTTATVTAYVSYPEDETGSLEVEEPKIEWMKVIAIKPGVSFKWLSLVMKLPLRASAQVGNIKGVTS